MALWPALRRRHCGAGIKYFGLATALLLALE
jgi:protein tyrosine/serine phosphatase